MEVVVPTPRTMPRRYLSDGPNDKIQAVIEAGVCRRLVELLMHQNPAVQTPALRSVGNVVTGDDLQTQVVIHCGALPCLLALLRSPKKGIRKEACWTISNITAGNSQQIQSVLDANLVLPLIELLTNAEFDIKKEAAWAISNATSGGSSDQIKFLVAQGCIRPLCDLISIADSKIITVALEVRHNRPPWSPPPQHPPPAHFAHSFAQQGSQKCGAYLEGSLTYSPKRQHV